MQHVTDSKILFRVAFFFKTFKSLRQYFLRSPIYIYFFFFLSFRTLHFPTSGWRCVSTFEWYATWYVVLKPSWGLKLAWFLFATCKEKSEPNFFLILMLISAFLILHLILICKLGKKTPKKQEGKTHSGCGTAILNLNPWWIKEENNYNKKNTVCCNLIDNFMTFSGRVEQTVQSYCKIWKKCWLPLQG